MEHIREDDRVIAQHDRRLKNLGPQETNSPMDGNDKTYSILIEAMIIRDQTNGNF